MMFTPSCLVPPHRVTHQDKFEELCMEFAERGWDYTKPSLVGYRSGRGPVQLLSGSHRWAAARDVGIAVPVVVWDSSEVRNAYGDLDMWMKIMRSGDEG